MSKWAIYIVLIYPVHATCTTHLILLDVITLIFGAKYKLRSEENDNII
jgi:hypothetical protein